MRTTRIESVETVSPTVKTLSFNDKMCRQTKPGQFLMLWVPGVDEIPLSVMSVDGERVSVAVKRIGEATRALHEMKIGDAIGVRGPYGNSFTVKKGRILVVGGGTGIAPLLFLAKRLKSEVTRLAFVLGAKTGDELLFMDKLSTFDKRKMKLVAITEDGSCGTAGLCTAPLESLLRNDEFAFIYTCGPELMMRSVFDIAEKHGIALEASLERLMRCALGLCGSCVIGKYRVCRDGPIFTSEQLREVKREFGFSKLDFDGRRISF